MDLKMFKDLTKREKILCLFLGLTLLIYIYINTVRAGVLEKKIQLEQKLSEVKDIHTSYINLNNSSRNDKIENGLSIINLQNEIFDMPISHYLDSIDSFMPVTTSSSLNIASINDTNIYYRDNIFEGKINFNNLNELIKLNLDNTWIVQYLKIDRIDTELFNTRLVHRSFTNKKLPETGIRYSDYSNLDKNNDLLEELYGSSEEYFESTTLEEIEDKNTTNKIEKNSNNKSHVSNNVKVKNNPASNEKEAASNDVNNSNNSKDMLKKKNEKDKYLKHLEHLLSGEYARIKETDPSINSSLTPVAIIDNSYFNLYNDNKFDPLVYNFYLENNLVTLKFKSSDEIEFNHLPSLNIGTKGIYLECKGSDNKLLITIGDDYENNDIQLNINIEKEEWVSFYIDLPLISNSKKYIKKISLLDNKESEEIYIRNVLAYEK